MREEVAVESTAEAYLELLAARGIHYFFANGGTDFGPIVEAYAKRLAHELPVPKPVTVPHEITAVAMAHGYTMVTGRPQVVMVHTIAGTANAVKVEFKSHVSLFRLPHHSRLAARGGMFSHHNHRNLILVACWAYLVCAVAIMKRIGARTIRSDKSLN